MHCPVWNSATFFLFTYSCSSSNLLRSLLSQASSWTESLLIQLLPYSPLLFKRISLDRLVLRASLICLDRQSLNLPMIVNPTSGGLGRVGWVVIQCLTIWDLAEKDLASLTCSTARSWSERDDSPTYIPSPLQNRLCKNILMPKRSDTQSICTCVLKVQNQTKQNGDTSHDTTFRKGRDKRTLLAINSITQKRNDHPTHFILILSRC